MSEIVKSDGDDLNILFYTLDSFRFDALAESPFLSRLLEENVSFENAIAPAAWTYPSHMSIFYGSYPHEHQMWLPESPVGPLPFVERLNQMGYNTFGLSSNVYFSTGYGVDESFDEFVDTYRPMLASGFDPYTPVRNAQAEGYGFAASAMTALAKARSPADVANFGLATLDKTIENSPPNGGHVVEDRWKFFKHGHRSSKRISKQIKRIIESERHDRRDNPFFIFANDMATHTPYDPPSRYLEEAISAKEKRTFDRRTGLFPLLNEHYSDGLPDGDLERLRRLYFGAAKYVGEQLQDIISMLTANDLRDETMVVITADHGEHLGEVDELGAMRFYHLQSVSQHLLQVPLIILHPDGLNETISEYVSLTDVGSYLLDDPRETDPADMTSDIVLSEMPAQPQYREKFESHDSIPDSVAKRIAEEHLVVGYMQDWKVAISSADEKWAWRDGQEESIDSAPKAIRNKVNNAVQSFNRNGTTEQRETSAAVKTQLEQLGYY